LDFTLAGCGFAACLEALLVVPAEALFRAATSSFHCLRNRSSSDCVSSTMVDLSDLSVHFKIAGALVVGAPVLGHGGSKETL
jgi:hypothetical protein